MRRLNPWRIDIVNKAPERVTLEYVNDGAGESHPIEFSVDDLYAVDSIGLPWIRQAFEAIYRDNEVIEQLHKLIAYDPEREFKGDL